MQASLALKLISDNCKIYKLSCFLNQQNEFNAADARFSEDPCIPLEMLLGVKKKAASFNSTF